VRYGGGLLDVDERQIKTCWDGDETLTPLHIQSFPHGSAEFTYRGWTASLIDHH
jgi:hypothetical protein